MIKKIAKFIEKKPNKLETDFFNLPSGEQKRIINKAAKDANIEQLSLIRSYKNKFGELKTDKYKI